MTAAAGAAVAPLTSTLYGNRHAWSNYDYDFAATARLCAGDSGSSQSVVCTQLLRMAVGSPLVFALHIQDDPDSLYVAHSLTDYPNVIGRVSPFDDHVVLLVGDDVESAHPLALPRSVFQRVSGHHAYNSAYIEGADGLAHPVAAVSRFPRVAAATGDTNVMDVRRFGLIPPSLAVAALSTSPTGE